MVSHDSANDRNLSERMLTVSEVAYILHVHPNTVRHWSDSGSLKTYRLGRRNDRRYMLSDINEFLNNNHSSETLPE